MYLNDIWISAEAIERVTVSGPALELRIAWRWDELPLLLDLPSQLTLRWDHIHRDDPHAGVPVELVGWGAECSAAPAVAVTLRLKRDSQEARLGSGQDREAMSVTRSLETHEAPLMPRNP